MLNKILITGALGQLGKAVIEQLRDNFIVFPSDIQTSKIYSNFIELDTTNKEKIDIVLSKYSPDIILNLAAMTDVDGCEKNVKMAEAINTESVKYLLRSFKGKFIQISTDYVFDGLNGPYAEDDKTNPSSVYGNTKYQAEEFIKKNSKDWCIIRTNVLFDYDENTKASFLKWVIDSLSNNQNIKVVNDQWNNPIWTKDLAKVIELVIQKNVQGLYHYGGADYLNRYDFAIMIAKIFNLNKDLISAIDTKSLNQAAKRPLRGGLVTKKIEHILNIKCNKLRDSLIEIKSQI